MFFFAFIFFLFESTFRLSVREFRLGEFQARSKVSYNTPFDLGKLFVKFSLWNGSCSVSGPGSSFTSHTLHTNYRGGLMALLLIIMIYTWRDMTWYLVCAIDGVLSVLGFLTPFKTVILVYNYSTMHNGIIVHGFCSNALLLYIHVIIRSVFIGTFFIRQSIDDNIHVLDFLLLLLIQSLCVLI